MKLTVFGIMTTRQKYSSPTPDEDREKMLRAQGEFSAEAEIRWEKTVARGWSDRKLKSV
jgi:hypothetical protein